jgi:hypothetical protein
MKEITCDVCILGAGTAGMAAAYALKGKGFTVSLVEKQPKLGGTAVNAWVETWIAGINPPYLLPIHQNLVDYGFAWGDINTSWVDPRFSKITDPKINGLIRFDPAALASRYYADMDADKNFSILTCYELQETKMKDARIIDSIIVKNKCSNESCHIQASYFIDSSGDGVLCRKAGCKAFLGEDDYSLFQEDLMKNKKAQVSLNEPSLFFKVESSNEQIPAAKIKKGKFNYDGYNDWHWVNPMSGFGISGMDVINNGVDKIYDESVSLIYGFWDFIKKEFARRKKAGEATYYIDSDMQTIPTGEHAEMLGVRESYRIECQKMLTQKDLTEKIDSEELKDYIACGSHEVDFHVYGSIDRSAVKEFNKNLKPSGIPYKCLVPVALDNTLIACRAFGASHIALAARRVNKDMAQLGWAAGHAIRMCLDNGNRLKTSDVDIAELRSSAYTDFTNSVKMLESKMK